MKKALVLLAVAAAMTSSTAHAEFLRFYSGNSPLAIDNSSTRMCPVASTACAGNADIRSTEDGALPYTPTSGGSLIVTGVHGGGSGGTGDIVI